MSDQTENLSAEVARRHRSIWEQAKEAPQRLLAGAAASIPATLPAIVGMPSGLRSIYRLATGTPDDPSQDGPIMSASRKSLELAGDIQDWTSRKLGVEPADAPAEVFPEMVGSLLTPAGIAKLPGTVGRLVAKTTPTTVKGIGALAGGLTAADAGLKSYIDGQEFDLPDATAKANASPAEPQAAPPQTQTQQPVQQVAQSVDPFDIPPVKKVESDPFDIPPATPQTQDVAGPDPFDIPPAQSLPAQMLDEIVQFAQEQYKPIIAGTAVAGAMLLTRRAAAARRAAQMSGDLIGGQPSESALTKTQTLNARALDSGAALKDSVKNAVGESADFDAKVATSGNPVAVNHKITAALHDGDLPEGLKYSFTPKQWFDGRAILSQKNPAEAQLLNDALIARSELTSRAKIEGYSPSFKRTNEQLQATIAAAEKNPAIVKMMGEYDNIMQTSLDYLQRSGIISAEKASGLKADFPHYVPFMEAENNSFFKRLADSSMSYKDRKFFNEFTNLFAREGGLSRVVDPGTAMESYIGHMVRLGEMNKVRSAYVDTMMGAKSKFVSKASKESEDTVTVFKNGAREVYKVTDPDVRSALELSPKSVAPMLNVARRTYQAATTGILAPWYAVKALTYDALMATSTAPQGFGLFRGEPVSALALGGSGVMRASYGHLTRLARDGFNKALLSDELGKPSILTQVMPRAMVERLADMAATAYANSTLSLFERSGAGGAGRFSEHLNYRNFQTQMDRISPDIASSPMGMRVMNFYRAAMDSAQNAVRLEYMARNGKKMPVEQLAKETRELTGDFARRGSSGPAIAYAEMVPYGNVSVQSLARWGKALRDNPIGTTVGVLNTVALPTLASQLYGSQDGAWQEYLRSLPMDERNGTLFFYIPGVAPERMPRFTLPSELHPIKAATDVLLDGIFGFSSGVIDSPQSSGIRAALEDLLGERGVAQVKAGLERAAPPMLPIGVSAAGAVAGQDIQQRGVKFDIKPVDRQVQGQPTSTTDVQLPFDAGTGAEYIHSNYVRNLVSHVFGAVGQMVMGTLGAAEQGYRGTGGNLATAADEAKQFASLELIKKVPSFAPIWGQEVAPGLRTQEHVGLQDKLSALREIQASVAAARKAPQDQLLSPQAIQAGTMFASYEKAFGPLVKQRADLMKRLDQTRSSVAMGPTMRMEKRTELVKELQDVESMLLENIKLLESDVSERLGRPLRIEDWKKNLE